jgi:hypothetical protein
MRCAFLATLWVQMHFKPSACMFGFVNLFADDVGFFGCKSHWVRARNDLNVSAWNVG